MIVWFAPATRSVVGSCETTSRPSLVSCTSSSSAPAPAVYADTSDVRVFSGACSRLPRWASTLMSRAPLRTRPTTQTA